MTTRALEAALLLRLLEQGRAKEGRRNQLLVQRFRSAGWLQPSTRRDEWLAKPQALPALRQRLAELLPDWEGEVRRLRDLGLDPYDATAIACIPRLQQPPAPFALLNRRNWMAATGLGPKRTAKLAPPGRLTKDWVMRIRCNAQLRLQWPDRTRDLTAHTDAEGEVLLSERQWLQRAGWERGGSQGTVISIENRGAYIDPPVPSGCLFVESSGWNVEVAVELLRSLPEWQWLHFGDIDPDGLEIAIHISGATGRPLRFYVPSFATEYLDLPHATGLRWPAAAGELPALAPFTTTGLGLSQETFVTDPRLADDLAREVSRLP